MWKLAQITLILIYVVLQILLYYKMNAKLDTALLRIKDLEVMLDERKTSENTLKTGGNSKTARALVKQLGGASTNEHVMLKRSLLQRQDDELDEILKRLQFVESR